MVDLIYLIPLLPLLIAPLVLLWGHRMPFKGSLLSIAAIGWGFIHSVILLWQGVHGTFPLPYEFAFSWFAFDFHEAQIGFYVDGLTLVMLFMVTLVALLIQIYSLGYMRGEKYFSRFYAYLSLFTAAMLGVVVSNNLLMFFIAWEIMGVCSYFLIGFYFQKDSAVYAGKKAFITTKLGDLGLFIGILMLFNSIQTLQFSQINEHVARGFLSPELATCIALFFFCGAIGKSAQLPLFVWLPDAMEGPTPVSALIHAATMVAAGVFLIARMFGVFQLSPLAMDIVAWVGCLTAFFAATMALATYDIKRVLAYSTISQLGYMVLALGVGGYTAGLFHLTTHAFFKALLFLAAGSVIHAVHTNDMRKMGGLSPKMTITTVTTFIACLAIAGIPPFAGFFSKDAIIAATLHHRPLAIIAIFTAALTSFYMFRMFFMTFLGNPRDRERHAHAHESPRSMTHPLIVLALLSVVSGWFLHHNDFFKHLVHFGEEAVHAGGPGISHLMLGVGLTALSVVSIMAAFLMFVKYPSWAQSAYAVCLPFRWVLERRYGFDAFFLFCVAVGDRIAAWSDWFDNRVLDKWAVDAIGALMLLFSKAQDWIDTYIVDAAVDATGYTTRHAGGIVRLAQTGYVQNYFLYVAVAVSLITVLMFS